jgi:hypothetical protein
MPQISTDPREPEKRTNDRTDERMKKDEWNTLARRRKAALQNIARDLGKDHAITKMMGSMAWGRNGAEQGPEGTLQTAINEAAYLDGAFNILNLWARDNDRPAQRLMIEQWNSRS